MTEETPETTEAVTPQEIPEDVCVIGLNLLQQSGMKHIAIVVTPDGRLICHTSSGLERHEIVGMLEAVRDETRK
jgi:hypothetical protein